MDWKNYENLSMLSDFYEFTMMNGYLENNMEDEYAYFDLYFRRIPDNGGFVIVAGLEEVVKYIQNLTKKTSNILKARICSAKNS